MSALAHETAADLPFSDEEFEQIRALVHEQTGIALATNKRQLVYSRLRRRLRELAIPSFSSYLARVREDADEFEEFCNALTTNLTHFFREHHHFEHLAREALPQILRDNAASRRLRIWSAGCSSGEEPYSIAITLRETLGAMSGWDVRILATDLDSRVLAHAAAGIYRAERFEKVPPARRDRWFESRGGNGYVARAELRSLITFKQLNLIGEWPMRGPFDVIFCRNVVIYFDKPTQRRLFARMAALQRPGATLCVGHSESLHTVSEDYDLVGQTIHRRRG